MKPPGKVAILLGSDVDVTPQLRWGVHLAMMRDLDLVVFQRIESEDERVVEVRLDETPQGSASHVVKEIRNLVDELSCLRAGARQGSGDENAELGHVVHVSLKQIHFRNLRSLRRVVVAELERSRTRLFTIVRKELEDMSDVEMALERRMLLRYVPCMMVFGVGFKEDFDPSRLLVAAAPGANGAAAMHFGAELAQTVEGAVTAVQVNPKVGVDAEQVGRRRLNRNLERALLGDDPVVESRVVIDNNVSSGIRTVWQEGGHDLVVVGCSRAQFDGSVGTRLGKGVPVVIVSAASPVVKPLLRFVEEGVERFVPQIGRKERIEIVDRLQSSAAWNFDFLVLMVLSTCMAAIGLIQNSTAVVIGAMLVAPLMTPLLGLGLAFQQGNPMLARVSLRSVAWGLPVALLGGFLVGFLTPGFVEPTREMLGRGGPGMLDLVVAFAAGLAAAYASSRSSLIAALPGVAIAAALVPPIATSGLALSLGDFPLAIGALLLFGINMVTIILAAMVSLWAVGFRKLKSPSRWMTWAGTSVLAVVLGLGVYLSLKSQEEELAAEFPEGLVQAVADGLGTDYELDSLAVAYDELGVQLNVQVVGATPAPEELATEVRTIASDHYAQSVRVRLLTRIKMRTKREKPPR